MAARSALPSPCWARIAFDDPDSKHAKLRAMRVSWRPTLPCKVWRDACAEEGTQTFILGLDVCNMKTAFDLAGGGEVSEKPGISDLMPQQVDVLDHRLIASRSSHVTFSAALRAGPYPGSPTVFRRGSRSEDRKRKGSRNGHYAKAREHVRTSIRRDETMPGQEFLTQLSNDTPATRC